MRTRVLVVVVAVVAVVGVATGAVGLALAARHDSPQHAMSSMMWSGPDDSSRGRAWGPGMGMGMGMGSMMNAGADSELAYLTEMVAHHEEAVTAAGELARSERAEMRAFGQSIIRTQSAQITQMRGWLEQWYPGQPADPDYEPMMRDLSGLDGDDLDRAFLQDMVHHHMMAVMMSQQLLAGDVAEHPQVNDLAVAIRDEQHAEILRMQRWLTDWFGAGQGWMHGMGRATSAEVPGRAG